MHRQSARQDDGVFRFRSSRYSEGRADHILEMRRRQFGKTPVNDVIVDARTQDPRREVRELWFGDPSAFPDLDAYDGVHRSLRRFINFHPPSTYSRYSIRGDPVLMDQLRMGSSRRRPDYISVPQSTAVYITAGVAGALRILCPAVLLPSTTMAERDTVITPYLTYLSHSAEAVFAHAEVRTCHLDQEGQIDLDHMESVMDHNTRVIILATVGNPLAIALKPQLFDELLKLVHKKEMEYCHPIIVFADTIYEFFRRNLEECIDPIQRVLRLGLDVPVVDMSSFSKGMAMAGQRVGHFLFYWSPSTKFQDERADVLESIGAVYGTTLCPVSSLLQQALGKMYIAINTGLPIEEKFAPFAAVLTALKDLTDLKGRGDAPAPVPAWVPERIIKKLEIDPTAWFTTSAIAKRTRKLAKKALGGYSSDIATPEVEAICQNLVDSNLAEVQRITVKRSQLTTALRSVVFEQITDEEISSAITAADLPWSVADFRRVLERLALQDLGVPVNGDPNEDIALCFYKLYDGVSVPPVGIKDGGLDLYHILNAPSEDANRFDRAEWLRIRSQWLNLAERCKIPTEDGHYQAYKDERRRQVFDRVDFFTRKLEAMRGEGLGIYLHPTYYRRGEGGEPVLDLDRINTFYVLWGFEALREHPCQAAELAAQCRAHNLPILANTPGEVFEVEAEPGTSFIRTVALSTTEQMQEIIEIIRTIATNLAFSAGGCE